MNEKIKSFKEFLKKSSSLGLIECLSVNKSLSNAEFLTFIQPVSYGGNVYNLMLKQ